MTNAKVDGQREWSARVIKRAVDGNFERHENQYERDRVERGSESPRRKFDFVRIDCVKVNWPLAVLRELQSHLVKTRLSDLSF